MIFFFFFQAEDGIRDKLVTGVQTCALPIFDRRIRRRHRSRWDASQGGGGERRRRGPRDRLRGHRRGRRPSLDREGARGEIGRASCRERVEKSVGGVFITRYTAGLR